eukprot:2723996-Amphidinium_carterae.1
MLHDVGLDVYHITIHTLKSNSSLTHHGGNSDSTPRCPRDDEKHLPSLLHSQSQPEKIRVEAAGQLLCDHLMIGSMDFEVLGCSQIARNLVADGMHCEMVVHIPHNMQQDCESR